MPIAECPFVENAEASDDDKKDKEEGDSEEEEKNAAHGGDGTSEERAKTDAAAPLASKGSYYDFGTLLHVTSER